ncbi:adenosylcobinamide-GDP ribazoletransferase [Pseudoalteromonas sp. S16_S37]|uniref:adenosylcobinamide-GDP ribazoletransferase n=1 Tax=Pseudoalteromonas sp. S16_S37 TaxID=2720228 RepID=UPI0016809D96|nr:adenosylcobinamide-GDP ribazoletransferase [Pseudoalteromonas sp. S16_S37]MBD1580837.1 adenosylcobinamide-GDP ribazoletransferase [Pseudoalteromonas sp. S16_S37]
MWCHVNKPTFLVAVVFLTRLPIKINSPVNDELLNDASRYFALVGLLIGLGLATIYAALQSLLPIEIAVILTLSAGILLTGAFHEDGFADVWDGFGGGWSVEQKLNIMKDSRLGTYGALALCLIMLLKFQLLVLLSATWYLPCIALILAHTLSRAMATSLIGLIPYVQLDGQSKVKPVAQYLSTSAKESVYLCALSVLLFAWLFGLLSLWHVVAMVACLWLVRKLCVLWFTKQLGGYTGDCLGAAQQIAEVSVYLMCLKVWL